MKRIATIAMLASLGTTAALAQTTPQASPPTSPGTTLPGTVETQPKLQLPGALPSTTKRAIVPPKVTPGASLTLSDDDAKIWIDRVIYSQDKKNVGEVANFKRDASGKVVELHADVGGFLGFGETRVKLLPSQFSTIGDHIELNISADEVNKLPKLPK